MALLPRSSEIKPLFIDLSPYNRHTSVCCCPPNLQHSPQSHLPDASTSISLYSPRCPPPNCISRDAQPHFRSQSEQHRSTDILHSRVSPHSPIPRAGIVRSNASRFQLASILLVSHLLRCCIGHTHPLSKYHCL